MTERRPPDPWQDERLEAAFAALTPAGAPNGLAGTVMTRVDTVTQRRWAVSRRTGLGMLAGAAVLAVLVVALWPWALRGGPFVAAPFAVKPQSGETLEFATDTFRFTFPAGWTVTEVGPSRGIGPVAVLGTLPVPASCGVPVADINCVYQQRMEPGTVRVFVGTGGGFGRFGTVFDREDPENVTTTRPTIAGMPAILDDYGDVENYYLANVWLRLAVADPGSLSNGPWFEVNARDPDSAVARSAFASLVRSLAFTPPPVPIDPASGPALGRLAIEQLDRDFRQGFGQTAGDNQYSCQPREPDTVVARGIRFSAGGDLGGDAPVDCSWDVAPEGESLWRVTISVDWSRGDQSGSWNERAWLDATGMVVGTDASGDGPPMAGATSPPPDVQPTPGPGATDAPRESILGLPLMTVDEALAFIATYPGDVEMAVQGWWASPPTPIPCPYTPDSDSSPVFPRCPDGESYLMAEPQSIFTTNPDGSGTSHTPVGGYIQPLVRDGATPPATLGPLAGDAPSIPVIVLGHVEDHRAAACPPDMTGPCESAFVADLIFKPGSTPPIVRVDLLDGTDQAGGATTLQPPVNEDLAVAAARRAAIGADRAPLVAVIRVTDETLSQVDPTLAIGDPGGRPSTVIWVVRLLVTDPNGVPHVRTFAMRDRELVEDSVTVHLPLGEPSVHVDTSP